MDWFGRAKLNFHASSATVTIKEKDGSATDLLSIVKEAVPVCQLNPLLFNGHLQTCWTSVNRAAPAVHYRRRTFEAEHSCYSGSFAVDFTYTKEDGAEKEEEEAVDTSLPPRTTYYSKAELEDLGSDDARPMLVILHGLSGGSHEVYLRHAIAPLLDSGNWEACVVNSRGCAMSKITTGILYNARATWDTRQVVRWLREKYPNRPLFGLGFSLGACILTNVCGSCAMMRV
jgi:predicted alpha/beta-fold hydrolase